MLTWIESTGEGDGVLIVYVVFGRLCCAYECFQHWPASPPAWKGPVSAFDAMECRRRIGGGVASCVFVGSSVQRALIDELFVSAVLWPGLCNIVPRSGVAKG